MNIVREKILANMPLYAFDECKDLTTFSVGAEYFTYDTDGELEADFEYIVVTVEKEWLFNYMKMHGVENPFDYLNNVYIWDESYGWFINAKALGKVASVEFF